MCFLKNYLFLNNVTKTLTEARLSLGSRAPPAVEVDGVLQIGSDFSGWAPEVQTFFNLGMIDRCLFKASSESDEKTQKINAFVHQALAGKKANVAADMVDRKLVKPGRLSFYLAGPPCPSFCPGGTGLGLGDARGKLMVKTVERILDEQPLTFVIENSSALLDKKFSPMMQQFAKVFEAAGYHVSAEKLDTLGLQFADIRLICFVCCS